MAGDSEGGEGGNECQGVWAVCGWRWGGGGFETSPPESRALAEAPWLMGGRGVNSNAAKLYLIFIHMNAAS